MHIIKETSKAISQLKNFTNQVFEVLEKLTSEYNELENKLC